MSSTLSFSQLPHCYEDSSDYSVWGSLPVTGWSRDRKPKHPNGMALPPNLWALQRAWILQSSWISLVGFSITGTGKYTVGRIYLFRLKIPQYLLNLLSFIWSKHHPKLEEKDPLLRALISAAPNNKEQLILSKREGSFPPFFSDLPRLNILISATC